MNDNMKPRIEEAVGSIVNAVKEIYDEEGNLRPAYKPRLLYNQVGDAAAREQVCVRKQLLVELAHVFDKARVSGLIADYHSAQLEWIIVNLNEVFKDEIEDPLKR